jgi:hypothetical protein
MCNPFREYPNIIVNGQALVVPLSMRTYWDDILSELSTGLIHAEVLELGDGTRAGTRPRIRSGGRGRRRRRLDGSGLGRRGRDCRWETLMVERVYNRAGVSGVALRRTRVVRALKERKKVRREG